VIVGIRPEVALAMVQLGMGTGTVATALDLQEGLVSLNSRTRLTQADAGRGAYVREVLALDSLPG